jgi:flagellar biogenesis protein FliO
MKYKNYHYYRKSDSHYNLGCVVGCSSGSFYILFCFVSGSLIAIIILVVLLAVVVENIKTTTTTANNTTKIIMAIRLPEIKQNKI